MMNRRFFLKRAVKGTAAATAALLVSAHTPYRQWVVYRKRHLLVLCCREDPRSYGLAKDVAALLAEYLPASKARVTRAPYHERFASLIKTNQLDVGIIARDLVPALLAGEPPFAEVGPTPARALYVLGDHLLISRTGFPARHAYQVVDTLDANHALLPDGVRAPADAVLGLADGPAPHAGVVAYLEGAAVPEETTEQAEAE